MAAAGRKRLEQPLANLFGDARAVIGEGQDEVAAFGAVDFEAADTALVADGFGCVAGKVVKDALHLFLVEVGYASIAEGELGLELFDEVFKEGVKVHPPNCEPVLVQLQ